MQDILQQARQASTSDEFAAVIGRLQADIREFDGRRVSLNGELEAVIFDGGDVASVQERISVVDAEVGTLKVALQGAIVRKGRAEAAEEAARLEATKAKLAAKAKEYTVSWRKFAKAIQAAREAHREFALAEYQINLLNDVLLHNGMSGSINTMAIKMKDLPDTAMFNDLNGMAQKVDKLLWELGRPDKKTELTFTRGHSLAAFVAQQAEAA